MSQIHFLKELDRLGLSIGNTHSGIEIKKGGIAVGKYHLKMSQITYGDRIAIIRYCESMKDSGYIPMGSGLMTAFEVASFLRLSERTIGRLRRNRTIRSYTVNNSMVFRKDEIEALVGGGK